MLVYGWAELTGIVFLPNDTVRIVGGNSGHGSATNFYNKMLPDYVCVRYVRGYKKGKYFLHHRRTEQETLFTDGLEFSYFDGVKNGVGATELEPVSNIQAPPELRALGRKIKQAWRVQILTRAKLGVYDARPETYSSFYRHQAIAIGDWLGFSLADLCAHEVSRWCYDAPNYARAEVPFIVRVEKGFDKMWVRNKKSIYDAIAQGRLTLEMLS